MAQCTKMKFPSVEKFVPGFLTDEKARWGRRSGVEFAYADVVMNFDRSRAWLIEIPNLQTNWLGKHQHQFNTVCIEISEL